MKIISLDVMNVGIVLAYVVSSYRPGDMPPIIESLSEKYADPIPQAVIITGIVIGFSVLTLLVVLSVSLMERTGKSDVKILERMMKE